MRRLTLIILAPAALAGCATVDDAGFPSLERRPVEAIIAAEQAARGVDPAPVAPPVASADGTAAAARWLAEAQAGAREFNAALAANRAQAAAGRNAAVGTEAWALGQVALSRIETARGRTRLALDQLDRLAQTAGEQAREGDRLAYASAQAEVRAIAEQQAASVRALSR